MWPALVAQKQYIQGRRLYAISKSKVRYSNSVYFLECWSIGNDVSRNAPFRKRCRFALSRRFMWTCNLAKTVEVYMREGKDQAIEWLRTKGRKNIEELGRTVVACGTAWE